LSSIIEVKTPRIVKASHLKIEDPEGVQELNKVQYRRGTARKTEGP
jgi:hypothetical protein